MIILAIETSCDDTCCAIIKASGKTKPVFKVLSNIVSSQVEIHRKWGGVYPTLAKREHQKNLPLILKKALNKAKPKHINYVLGKNPEIDLITVTVGPGLDPCLWVGVNFAKDLARSWQLPIIPINHIEAHIYANFLSPKYLIQNTEYLFPAICLVVSGGHTQLILMKSYGQYKIIGETRDDAAGECFDKVARILGLSYPGGPAIAKEAKFKVESLKSKVKLPRPMIYQKNYDFSFSGLKTAVLYNFRSQKPKIRKSKEYIRAVCTDTQQAIIDVLIHKTIKATRDYKVKTIILGGGVTANEQLRKQFKVQSLKFKVNFLVPPKNLCTDNAAMIAVAAYFHWLKGEKERPEKIEVNANLGL